MTPKKEFKDDFWPKIKRWFYEKFSNGQRVQDVAIDDWPEVYRKGDDTIIVRAKYLTPERYINGQYAIKNGNLGFGGLILIGIFALGETGSFFDLNILHSFLFVGIGGVLILAATKDKLIRFAYGKVTKVILKPDRVIIKRGAQGNRTLASSPEVCLSARIVPHTRTNEEAGKLHTIQKKKPYQDQQMRVAAYEQSFFVDMFNGAQAVRVAEVYDQFWAERLSNGLQAADTLHKEMLMEKARKTAQRVEVGDRSLERWDG